MSEDSQSGLEIDNTNLVFFIALIAFALVFYVLAAVLGVKSFADIALGAGTGILSSLFVIWSYRRFAEERATRRMSKESALASASLTREFLVKHFEQVVPVKTYARTSGPTEDFRRDFSPHLEKSKIYFHKGDDASFASFRIATLANHPALTSKLQLMLCVLDPRASALVRLRAKLELESGGNGNYSERALAAQEDEVRNKIHLTLYSLYTVRHRRQSQVFFHQDNPFYRVEIFDEVVFLSYYLGGEFPGTYLFNRNSYVYQAHLNSFRMTCDNPHFTINFHSGLSAEAFHSDLRKLGFSGSLEDLEATRVSEFRRKNQALPFETNNPF